jgi:hypothetical protein
MVRTEGGLSRLGTLVSRLASGLGSNSLARKKPGAQIPSPLLRFSPVGFARWHRPGGLVVSYLPTQGALDLLSPTSSGRC